MNGPRILGLVVLIVGIVLLGMAYNAAQSPGEQLFEGVMGRFTEQTMWLIILGVAGVVGGGALLVFGKK